MVKYPTTVQEDLDSNPGCGNGPFSEITNSLFISKEIGDGCISLSPLE